MRESRPLEANDTLAEAIHRRVFRSRNAGTARSALAMAQEVDSFRFSKRHARARH